MIDDSSLFHGVYDPVKAREYYLRTRKLKGRRRTTATLTDPGKGGRRPTAAARRAGGKLNRADTKSRRAELKAQRAALQKRLDHLRDVLAAKVKEAKRRSGQPTPKKHAKGKASETQASKASSGGKGKADKPLTASQKADKAKAAKKAYEKEHPTSLSQDIKVLEKQIADIRAQIKKAVEDSRRAKRSTAGKK